jgi:LuxR family quorum sensing-dependent transcriptional regulator
MATFQGRYFQTALDAIEQFDHAETSSALCKQLAKAVASFGYQYVCVISAPTAQQRSFDEKVLLNGWPRGWFEQYRTSNFTLHDPVAKFLRTQSRAFKWSEAPIPKDDQLARSVMTISATDYRMRRGFGIPIHGLNGYQAGVSFAGCEVDDVKEANAAVQMIGIYAFNRLANLKFASRKDRVLTDREREILNWIAAGKTAWDTGGILRIAEDTVNKHIASAMRKLNVHTRAQAVAESIRRGEIQT